ncbi:MAG: cell division protein FtsB [Pseudomonadota bacterium]|nr:cell division protein FtsB [Pseudomonadota bacterium]
MRWLRVLLVLLVGLLALLQLRLWTGEGGMRSVAVLEEGVQSQSRENVGLQQRNAALAAEVEDLKTGEAAVEERARSELGMILPGETFYRVVESERRDDTGPGTTEPPPEDGDSP